jgi:hypothetical protein
MLLAGLALPFCVEMTDDDLVCRSSEGTHTRQGRHVSFYPGCAASAIRANDIVVTVNHCRDEDLGASPHGGLWLFETRAGLYFYLRLPSTPYARTIYQAVVDSKIRHICACSDGTEAEAHGNHLVIRKANLRTITLLLGAPAHFPATWVAVAGPESEARVDREIACALRDQQTALDPSTPRERTELEKAQARIAFLEGEVARLGAALRDAPSAC